MSGPRSPKSASQPAASVEITGVDFTEVRTGEDSRQRGWFWHWNELHTEYEPLLQHSGIGLITSYIVWTDRREHSPYRGYAFPSLQSQAAFSGSDRAELITINRILVALDLLEIRKEMVLRIDDKGHKWRVPHNLYRVKDRSGDPHLTAADVLRVLDLAEQRNDVYRHIHHILTSAFVPISHNNIWHQILAELRPTAVWQRLSARAMREEARLSARSKAGHRSRRGPDADPGPADVPPPTQFPSPLPAAGEESDLFVPGSELAESTVTGEITSPTLGATETSVQPTNRGLPTRVDPGHHGLAHIPETSDGASNRTRPTSVAPSNPMYDQLIQTTSTTSADPPFGNHAVTGKSAVVTGAVTRPGHESTPAIGHVEQPAPDHGPDRAATFLAFQEANGRTASLAEERLLGNIAGEVGERGWNLVASAIYEAVNSGSSFVAPKRVREIVRRWVRDGGPEIRGNGTDLLLNERVASKAEEIREPVASAGTPEPPVWEQFWVAEAGISSDSLWRAVIDLVEQSGAVRPADVHDYLKSAVLIERVGASTLRLAVPHEVTRQRIERRWRAELEEALGRLLGKAWELDIEVIPNLHRHSA